MSKFCFACQSSKTSGSVCSRRSVGVWQPALKCLAEVALTRVNWSPLKGQLKSSGMKFPETSCVAPDFCHTPFSVSSTSQRMSTISASFFSSLKCIGRGNKEVFWLISKLWGWLIFWGHTLLTNLKMSWSKNSSNTLKKRTWHNFLNNNCSASDKR